VQRALVVSIHDVASLTWRRVERMLAELTDWGVARCSLLVVPNYHRSGPSLGDTTFTEWLHQRAERGDEIVIHGYYHERPRRAGEGARQKLITRVYTADEGEFYDLDRDQAFRLMQQAQGEFAAEGFHPSGFIAPAWLLGAGAEQAAIDAGFRYTTTLRSVRDFVSGQEFISQSLVYSVRSDWRCAASLFWNRLLFRRLARNPLLRLGLHPPDIEHPGVWRQIRALVQRALRDRVPTVYETWLAGQPSSVPELR
jgi:predicted deacetylase